MSRFDLESNTRKQENQFIESRDMLELKYLPDQILHRERQIDQLLDDFFLDAFQGGSAAVTLIGPSGTGKTATVKYVRKRIEEENSTDGLEIVYVNCEKRSGREGVFKSILHQIGLEYERGFGIEHNVERLFNHINADEDAEVTDLIVILDELDSLNREDYINKTLYQLTTPSEIAEETEEEFNPNISVLAISNDQKITTRFNEAVKSRMQRKDISFPPYETQEIKDILEARQKKAFSTEILGDNALAFLAKEVKTKFDSDLRAGITILKNIPKVLNEKQGVKNEKKVQLELVREAVKKVQRGAVEEAIRVNDEHFLVLISSLVQSLEDGENRQKDINKRYRQACEYAALGKDDAEDGVKSKTYVYRKLEELDQENILNRTKDFEMDQNPYTYESLVYLDFLNEIVQEHLRREGLADKMEENRMKSKQALEESVGEELQQFVK